MLTVEAVVVTTGLESVLGTKYHRGHDLDAHTGELSDWYCSGRAGMNILPTSGCGCLLSSASC